MTMPQLDRLSACPRCAERLEEADRFCRACGAELTGVEGPSRTYEPFGPAQRTPAQGPDVGQPGTDGGVRAPVPSSAADAESAPVGSDFMLLPPGEQSAGAVAPTPTATPAPAPVSWSAYGSPSAQAHGGPESTSAPTPPASAVAGETASILDTGTPGDALRALIDAEGPPAISSNPTGAAATSASPTVPTAPTGPGAASSASAVTAGPAPEGTLCVACSTGGVDGYGYCDHCGHKQPRERDHMEGELGSVAAASDRGLRHHRNEDFFAIVEATTADGAPATIAVVCDGVSSATRPDDASAAAAQAAGAAMCTSVPQGTPPQEAMQEALVAAAESVTALAAETPNEPSKNAPACTIISTLNAGGLLTVGWVGDSRAYWVPEDRTLPASRLTEDDSWAAQMVAAGLMEEDEAYADARAHAITGWLGADAYEFEPHTASFTPDRPGVVVVCTDGLWNYAEAPADMAAAVPRDARTRPLQSARHLVGYALDGGGQDNVTVAVVPIPSVSTAGAEAGARA